MLSIDYNNIMSYLNDLWCLWDPYNSKKVFVYIGNLIAVFFNKLFYLPAYIAQHLNNTLIPNFHSWA